MQKGTKREVEEETIGAYLEILLLSAREATVRGASGRDKLGRRRRVTNRYIYHLTSINKKGKNVRANARKMRRLNLADTPKTLNERREEAYDAVMSNPSEILKTTAR